MKKTNNEFKKLSEKEILQLQNDIKDTLEQEVPDYRNGIDKDKNIPEHFLERKLNQINFTRRLYFLFIFPMYLFLIISNILVIFLVQSIIIKIVYIFFSIVIFVLSLIVVMVRLFLFGDLDRIRRKILVSNNEYLIANFLTTEKRIRHRYIIPNQNGREFEIGKSKSGKPFTYVINNKCIWTNENLIPEIFYFIGIPNPIDFDTVKYLMIYFQNLRDGQPEKNQDLKLDCRYDAETLSIMKNAKFMTEMHPEDRDKDKQWMMLIAVIFIGCVILIVVLALIMNNKHTEVIQLNNTGR